MCSVRVERDLLDFLGGGARLPRCTVAAERRSGARGPCSSPKPCATPSRGSSRAGTRAPIHGAESCPARRTAVRWPARGRRTESLRSAAPPATVGLPTPVDWLARTAGCRRHTPRTALGTVATVKDCPATASTRSSPGRCRWRRRPRSPWCPRTRPSYSRSRCGRAWAALREEARTRWLAAIPPDTLHARRREAREFVHWKNRLGMTCFSRCPPPEVGVPYAKRMDARPIGCGTPRVETSHEVGTRVQYAADHVGGRRQRSGASAQDGQWTW